MSEGGRDRRLDGLVGCICKSLNAFVAPHSLAAATHFSLLVVAVVAAVAVVVLLLLFVSCRWHCQCFDFLPLWLTNLRRACRAGKHNHHYCCNQHIWQA